MLGNTTVDEMESPAFSFAIYGPPPFPAHIQLCAPEREGGKRDCGLDPGELLLRRRPNSSNLKVFNEHCPHAALWYVFSLGLIGKCF
ncbi:unnamed protein product [Prunus armeniaca]